MTTKDEFLYPRSRYHGPIKPEELVFNANLQEFTQRISFICNLQTNNKLSAEASYQQIKDLWQHRVHQQLTKNYRKGFLRFTPMGGLKVVSITSDARSHL